MAVEVVSCDYSGHFCQRISVVRVVDCFGETGPDSCARVHVQERETDGEVDPGAERFVNVEVASASHQKDDAGMSLKSPPQARCIGFKLEVLGRRRLKKCVGMIEHE